LKNRNKGVGVRKGVKITLQGGLKGHESFRRYIQESATNLHLEGYLQLSLDNSAIIYAVGDSDNVELLIDKIYSRKKLDAIEQIIVTPMDIIRDFRGIFRVITN
jgi:acylphosphatase